MRQLTEGAPRKASNLAYPHPGEMANTGSPLLTVMDISRVIARANVPVSDLQYIRAGNAATVTTLESPVELPGEVTVVSPALDPNSTTAELWVLVPNTGERLKPGLSIQVAIVAQSICDALVIPVAALLPSQEGSADTVLVVGADSKAHQQKIATGIREKDLVQVLNGLSLGDQVVTVGGFGLQDNTAVRVESKEQTGKSDQHD